MLVKGTPSIQLCIEAPPPFAQQPGIQKGLLQDQAGDSAYRAAR